MAAGKFRWLSGESLVRKWQRATGFRSYFCADCGAPVPNPLRDTGYVWVPAGLLDDDEPLEVAMQLHVDSKASWTRLPEGGKQYAKSPALAELIAELHRLDSPNGA